MKPICVKCQRFFRMKKSGYYFTEGMPKENGAKQGTAEKEKWKPYKIWAGDLWECLGCGFQIVSGVGGAPMAEHYQSDFKGVHERLNAGQLQVNDC